MPRDYQGGLFGLLREGQATPTRFCVALTDANLELPVSCIKGIRAALTVLDDGTKPPIAAASAAFDKFEKGERPLVLGWATTIEDAKRAAEAGVAESAANLVLGYALSEGDLDRLRAQHAAAAEPPKQPQAPTASQQRLDVTRLLAQPSDVPEAPWQPSFEAAKTALALLAMHDGKGTQAVAWARVLRQTTDNPLYDEVVSLMLASLPIQWSE